MMYVLVLLSAAIMEELELKWVCRGWGVDLLLFSRGCWRKHDSETRNMWSSSQTKINSVTCASCWDLYTRILLRCTDQWMLSGYNHWRRVQLKRNGTRWRTGGEVKGKLANGVGGQYPSHYLGAWCIQHYYRWCTHLDCK